MKTKIIVERIYKKVKVPMAHCSICGEILRGNNSGFSPFKCSCGTWNYDMVKNEYYILK